MARLDSVFIEFTLEGLLQQHIERVEILNPVIYIGEHLFWYVEHYRVDPEDQRAQAKAPSEGTWDIGEIAAYNGNLVIAPKGTPLPGFDTPFPFSCKTKLGAGVIEATLKIPEGDYPIPDIELLFEGLQGSVEFNLPTKGIDNNLVEVLEAARIRYKQFESEEAYLSLTYDAEGIYTQFGTEAYEGYFNGAINVYIDENYSWDGWIAGTGINPEPLTAVLTPEYFNMTGEVDLSLVANGTIKELTEAKGTFRGREEGTIHITALDAVKEEVIAPDKVTQWLAEAGIDLLQTFRYDTARGDFNLLGREGLLKFLLAGPDGKREFEVLVHDHRPLEPLAMPNP